MPDITPISNLPTYDPNALTSATSKMGKEDFLNLLVTQLRYQDPLEPMKDTEFVSQLANFSSLEQLSNISNSLDMSSQLDYILSQTIANTMATTLIGKYVIASGDSIQHIAGSENRLHFNLDSDAANVEIKVLDSDGNIIRTMQAENLASGSNELIWDGKDDKGTDVGSAEYTFEVTATDSAGNAVGSQTRIEGLVESVRYQDGQGYLIINGQRLALSDIIEIISGDSQDNNDNPIMRHR
jgi:flagellar basal-body rod modification protein FlgD